MLTADVNEEAEEEEEEEMAAEGVGVVGGRSRWGGARRK